MVPRLPVIARAELEALLPRSMVIDAVRQAFVRHAKGEGFAPPPSHIQFDEARGDCHVKCGGFRGDEYFVVKVATGFYDNPQHGLPVNDGLVIVLDARSGRPLVVFDDHGLLTDLRTAAAGALAAEAGCVPGIDTLGIVGSGTQARRQASWITAHLGLGTIVVHARSDERAREMRDDLEPTGLGVDVAESVDELFERCRLVVTCTPSTSFVVPDHAARPGTHIVAVGADMPGKQELHPALFARAGAILCDDIVQCADHGDFAHAVAAGLARTEDAISLGLVLANTAVARTIPDELTIADLIGLGAQDAAIATLALSSLP